VTENGRPMGKLANIPSNLLYIGYFGPNPILWAISWIAENIH